jgi:hypothetical protein
MLLLTVCLLGFGRVCSKIGKWWKNVLVLVFPVGFMWKSGTPLDSFDA